ncbi:MAG: hypothetical protein ABSF83_06670 [Nitrososphaerales archaeon]
MSATSDAQAGPPTRRSHRRSNALWAAAVVLVALFAAYAYASSSASPPPPSTTVTRTTRTSYDVTASSIVLSAVQQDPAGYTEASSGPLAPTYPGELSAADAILETSGSAANGNVTVAVFATTNSSQSYFDEFASHVRGLAGFTDITSVIGAYEQYGGCYAYGEDVDGIGVANGICVDGNVFLQVHLSSSEQFSYLEDDLSSLMGAAYQSV